METTASSPPRFVQRRLPWLIAAGALILFLATLNTGYAYRGMQTLAVATGLEWKPQFTAPLHYILTYPVRWFSAGLQPIVLNALAAFCAALSLGLLARSVALLPQDRTRDQRSLEHNEQGLLTIPAAWMPPLLAALVCGLQLTFWENAVIGTGEALDLLLFAYAVRCLLEFRVSQKNSWLYRAMLVQTLGMTNNYAMIAVLPAFLVAVVWMKGLAFFNLKFLGRLLLCGIAGLSFYLVLPLINAFSDVPEAGFGPSFMTMLGLQRRALMTVWHNRFQLSVAAVIPLLPLPFIGIRWPAQFGDISAAGNALTNLMMHVIHAVFLAFCLAVTFDPAFGPRRFATIWDMLPVYFLSALSIGYFVGYFLLVFSPRVSATAQSWQRPSPLRNAMNHALTGAVWVAAVAVPAGLIYKNFGLIRLGSQAGLRPLAEGMIRSLPPAGGVVVGDEQPLLHALALVLKRTGTEAKFLLVHSQSLGQRLYHRQLSQKYPGRWPSLPGENLRSIDIGTQLQLFLEVQKVMPFYYLQPTFGVYLERHYLKPLGLVYQMIPYSNETILPPVMSPGEIDATDKAWKTFLASQLPLYERGVKRKAPYPAVTAVAAICSRMLNYFGVEIQRTEDYKRASEYFDLALAANPDNPTAFVNHEYNRQVQAGNRESLPPSPAAERRFAPYTSNYGPLLGRNGPPDEPTVCYIVSEFFGHARNFRQAAHYLSRTLAFQPELLPARLNFASSLIQLRLPDRALKFIAETRQLPSVQSADITSQVALDQVEAWAYVSKNDMPKAEAILRAAQTKYPSLADPFAALINIYISTGRSTNAIAVIEEQLRIQPKNVDALINYGVLLFQQGQATNAISYFDRALTVNPDSRIALMNRAICNLTAGKLADAERDYGTLERTPLGRHHMVAYGLQEVYWRKKDRKNCLRYIEDYLDLAPPGTPEFRFMEERQAQLKDGSFKL
jgi:Tfp pilus assembly protein PilF